MSRTSLVVELAGFNIGIELTQLIVVVLAMPSMMLLSRTRAYRGVRIALAAAGLILAGGWFGERTTMLAHNPFEGVSEALVANPFLVAASLAAMSVLAWLLPALRLPHDHPDVESSQRALVSPP